MTQSGFTVIEALVSIILMMLAAVIIYQVFFLLDTDHVALTKTTEQRQETVALAAISRDMRQMIPNNPQLGETFDADFEASANRLAFIRHVPPTAAHSGVWQTVAGLQPNGPNTTLSYQITRRPWQNPVQPTDHPPAIITMELAGELAWFYLSTDADGTRSWNNEFTAEDGLPEAIALASSPEAILAQAVLLIRPRNQRIEFVAN